MDPAQLPEEELIRLAVGVLAHLLPGVPDSVAGGSARAVAVAVAASLSPARLAGHGCRRPREPARPGPGRDRLAPDTHRPRPTGAGDDGRVVGGLGPQRGHPEVEHRVASRRGRRSAPSLDRRGRHRGTAGHAEHPAGACRRGRQRGGGRSPDGRSPACRPRRDPGERRRRRVRPAAPAEPAHGARARPRTACASWRRTLAATLDEPVTPAHSTTSLAPPPPVDGLGAGAGGVHRRAIRRAGYAVHGELDALTPTDHRLPGTVDRGRTLELAVTACLRSWHLRGSS